MKELPYQRELVRFWSASTAGFAAALFRIAFGLLAVWTALGVLLNRERYFSQQGMIPWRVVSEHNWSSWSLLAIAPESDRWLFVVCCALLVASFGYLLGAAPRLCSAVIFVVHVSLHHRNPYIFNSGDRLFLMLSSLGVFLPLGRVASLSALWRSRRPSATELPPAGIWSQRLIQLQICHVYWFSCFSKLRHAGWQQGTAMRDVLVSPVFSEWPVQLDASLPALLLTWGTLLFEFGFPLAVFNERLRRPALIAGVLFHLGIELSMKIPMFSAIMAVSYALFLQEHEAKWLLCRVGLAGSSIRGAATAS